MSRYQSGWMIKQPVPEAIQKNLAQYPSLLQQLLFNRGITSGNEAETYLQVNGSIYNPMQLFGMQLAVTRIQEAIAQKEQIAVYGDYDVDGVTATALLVLALQSMSAEVKGFIPNRFEEGYGLSKEPLQKLFDEGIRLVITVDCGIRSGQEVDFCNELGMDVILTDHHEPHGDVPNAIAVICPKQEGDLYPEKNLAGVGLAFKLAEALYHACPSPTTQESDFYDLVALGTVADMVPLTGENRALVKAGLQQMKLQQRLGIRALAGAAGINLETINTGNIGFGLGPRINASGRLETAQMAYDLLTTHDFQAAGLLAQKLDDLNRKRQEETRQNVDKAIALIAERPDSDIIIAFDTEFNKGIVGLVASKLVEKFYRPAVVGQIEEGEIRASCRSIPEFHITHALDECAELFTHHGGHSMAAGFTLLMDNHEFFLQRLGDIARRELGELDLCPELVIDMEIILNEIKPVELFEVLAKIEPTGQNNPEVVFCSRNLKVEKYRTVGKEDNHLQLSLRDNNITYKAIAFQRGNLSKEIPQWIDVAYTFEKNTFRGETEIQLNVKDIRPSSVS